MKNFALLFLFLATGGTIYSQGNPEVLGVQPIQQSISADPSTSIEVIFNQAVDPLSLNDTTFMVWERWSGIHKGKLSFNSKRTKLSFNPVSGIYFYQLKAGNFIETKKMILMK